MPINLEKSPLKYLFFSDKIVWISIILLFLLSGCIPLGTSGSDDVEVFHNGELDITPKNDVPKTIYVDVRDNRGQIPYLPRDIEKMLVSHDFDITDSPSKAGYILHVSLLQEGDVSSEILRSLVDAGYGGEARFSGSGGAGLLADILLVHRHVPSSKRASRTRLKNISRRNAVGSQQMRIGFFVDHPLPEHRDIPGFFTDALAKELRRVVVFGPAQKDEDSDKI